MKRLVILVLSFIMLAGCQKSGTMPINETPLSQTTKLQADEVVTLPSGAQFLSFKGWKVTPYEYGVKLKSPEGSMRVELYELSAQELESAEDAIDETYRRFKPTVDLEVIQKRDWKKINGYSEVAQHDFINEDAQYIGLIVARKQGNLWHTFVTVARLDAYNKRKHQMQAMYDSFKSPTEVALGLKVDLTPHELTNKPFDAQAAAKFDHYMNAVLKEFNVPGVAVAVVQKGKVVHLKGYGTRSYGQGLPVTEKTLFPVGSISKVFTGYLASEAVKQGKISWDTPIKQILPEFVTGDPNLTQSITIHNGLTMASKLPRRDFIMAFRNDNASEMLKQMANIHPTSLLKENHSLYSNHSVSSAGYAVARSFVSEGSLDEAWLNAMQSQVLAPLNMTASSYELEHVKTVEHALPTSFDIFGTVIDVPVETNAYIFSGYAPAGGLWSNAEDMAKFMIAELNHKDPAHLQRVIPITKLAELALMDYGITYMLSESEGIKTRLHSGSLTGYQAQMSLFPELDLGITVMSNSSIAYAIQPAIYKVYDLVTGTHYADKSIATWQITMKEFEKSYQENKKSIQTTPDTAWLEPLVGKYHGEDFGDIEIVTIDGKGIMKAKMWQSEFVQNPEKPDHLTLTQLPIAGIEFKIVTVDGKVSELILHEEQLKYAQYDYVLKKM